MKTIVLQGIGFIAVLFFILSYQVKSNKGLFIMQSLGSTLFCVQFALMGQFSGSLSLLLTIVRNMMLTHYRDWAWVRWKGWVVVFSALCVVIMAVTWRGPISILPFLAILCGTICYFSDNAQRIRFGNLVCSTPCWLIYDFLIRSWGGVLTETITLSSIIISIIRYGWKSLGQNQFGD